MLVRKLLFFKKIRILKPYGTIEMKKRSFSILLSFLLTWLVLSSSAQAGQVVTDEVKAWAKGAIEQEKALKTIGAPNTVAVLYFSNKTNWSDLDLLQKGLTLMLITDLSRVKEIQLVERVKIQALLEELNLEVSGLVEPGTSSRMGKLLGVEHLIGGDILTGKTEELFQLKSNLLKVQTEKVFGRPWTEGELLAELLRMEKDLLFEIIKELKIELSLEQKAELRKFLTTNLNALLYLFQGIDYSDRRDYARAAEFYKKALAEDPNLSLAQECLLELQALNLWGVIEAYSEPERGGIPEPTSNYRPDYRDLTEREKRSYETDDEINNKTDDDTDEEIDIDKYTQGDPPPIVDRLSLIEAQSNIVTDDTLRAGVNNGEFIPGYLVPTDAGAGYQGWGYNWTDGAYEPGLQTLGVDGPENPTHFLTEDNLAWINDDPFLAYAVQVEEDRLNRKILEMHLEYEQVDIRTTITDALYYGDIRERDDLLMQQADAQAGRVLKDQNGNWVRIQQYILRPNDQTVQVLNVCLRGAGAGDLSGLSTMDWTTRFTGSYDGDLRDLPWNEWLNTRDCFGTRYVLSPSGSPELDNMYVRFTNPGDESLKESRTFGKRIEYLPESYMQPVTGEQLTINDSTQPYVFSIADAPESGKYTVDSHDFGGFDYVFQPDDSDLQRINVAFFIVGDIDDNGGEYTEKINDIWDALRVNEGGDGTPNIGNNNMEIAIDAEQSFFNRPIDVVYIPMSRMLWKNL
jgi:TolB-like protein